MAFTLRVNGKTYEVEAEPETPLLWVLQPGAGHHLIDLLSKQAPSYHHMLYRLNR